MLEFKKWMETSYVREDIPECYFLCPSLNNPQQLANRVLHGVSGISSSFEGISYFYSNILMIMKGILTEQLNKLSKVMYDNPHYLASKGQEAFIRVVGTPIPRNVFYEMLSKCIREFAYLASEHHPQVPDVDDLVIRVFQLLRISDKNNDLETARDFNVLVRVVYNAIITVNSKLKNPISDLANIIGKEMTQKAGRFEREAEWRIKSQYTRGEQGEVKRVPVLKIHDGALLWVSPNPSKLQDTVKEYNLDRVYKVQYIQYEDTHKILSDKSATFEDLASIQFQGSGMNYSDKQNAFNKGGWWDSGAGSTTPPSYRAVTNLLQQAKGYKSQPKKPKWGTV